MRQSTKHILLTSIAVLTVGVVTMLGMGDALADYTGGETLATMATSGKVTESIGSTGYLIRQGANILAAILLIGAFTKGYAAMRDGKDLGKNIGLSALMVLAAGGIFAANQLGQGAAKSLGSTGTETIGKDTGAKIGW